MRLFWMSYVKMTKNGESFALTVKYYVKEKYDLPFNFRKMDCVSDIDK